MQCFFSIKRVITLVNNSF